MFSCSVQCSPLSCQSSPYDNGTAVSVGEERTKLIQYHLSCHTIFSFILLFFLFHLLFCTLLKVTNPNFAYIYVLQLNVCIYKQRSMYTFQYPIQRMTLHYYNILIVV
jgi:hypothetical protein